jgi:hypothetical protein
MGWDCLTHSFTVHPPDDTWVNMEKQWNDSDMKKPKDWDKILS